MVSFNVPVVMNAREVFVISGVSSDLKTVHKRYSA